MVDVQSFIITYNNITCQYQKIKKIKQAIKARYNLIYPNAKNLFVSIRHILIYLPSVKSINQR